MAAAVRGPALLANLGQTSWFETLSGGLWGVLRLIGALLLASAAAVALGALYKHLG